MATTAELAQPATPEEHFDRWAQVYDEQANPLLSLESRYLSQMLSNVHDKDVVDLGCGTGRWIRVLQAQSPRLLVGLDRSANMLRKAEGIFNVRADCTSLPLADSCADLVLSSFVAGYLDDLQNFATELARIVRPNGSVFLSDADAQTFREMGWRRSFKVDGHEFEFAGSQRHVDEIVKTFGDAGLEAVCILRPPFGLPEQELLERNGKTGSVAALNGRPPIFIVQFKKKPATEIRSLRVDLALCSATVSVGPNESVVADLAIREGQIAFLVPKCSSGTRSQIDLEGYLLLPGLINAHDHLEFGLFPRLGKGPYFNCSEWATDIHLRHADLIAQHRAVPRKTRLWWGALKNLLSGVTTVCHHNPFEPEFLHPDFPVRVIRDFSWAHSLSLDSEVDVKHRSTREDLPFIIHAAEGTDESSANELASLDHLGALDRRTVVVHGTALSNRDTQLLNERGCSLIWCCSSSDFLYSRRHSAEFIRSLNRVAIGTDSSMTSAGDMLDELRLIASTGDLGPADIWRLVTDRSADVLRLKGGSPTLVPGHCADVIAIRDRKLSPCGTLVRSSFSDIELVALAGKIRLVSDELFERLPVRLRTGLQALEVDGVVRWLRAPVNELMSDVETYLGSEIYLGGKRVRRVYDN